MRGAEYLKRYPFLSKFDAEFTPLLFARAMPGGPVERTAYESFKSEFLERLKSALPLDGLFLELHGAMNVEGMDDAEGDWIASAREVAGHDCLISASYDLHGNASARQIEQLDMLAAFRTAPHVDVEVTREKACSILVDCIERGIRPVRAFAALPIALPGEVTSTEWEPGASLYASLQQTDKMPGVIDASILIGYAWADEPRVGGSVVVTGTNRAIAESEARRLAEQFWSVREDFKFGVPTGSIDECILRALAAPEKSVFISDSGDNPTAGGAGDVPVFLRHLIEHRAENAVIAGLTDAAATAACYAAGEGATLDLSLGGKLDPRTSAPLPVLARVLKLDPSSDRQALIGIDGVKAIITERRRTFHLISDMQRMGVEPLEHKIVVIKIGYLEPDLKRNAPLALLALSPGAVNQDIVRLPFKRVRRPMFPLDREFPQSPVDVKLFE